MITCSGFKLESPNLHQICILGFSQLVLKMGVIDLDLQGHLAIISTQETAFNFAFVYWSKPAKGCYTSQTCSCFLGEDHMWWLSYCKWGWKPHAEQKDKNLHAFVFCIIFTDIIFLFDIHEIMEYHWSYHYWWIPCLAAWDFFHCYNHWWLTLSWFTFFIIWKQHWWRHYWDLFQTYWALIQYKDVILPV